ncbi:P-loop NTPase fold protein [Pedobacter jejuensis]|uniref:KAP NTPase domain-containing protein n=1 Tax=Pedobacter jejuensis TaxID=1268550 RepID=A0A3N0BWW1_9SPHI|nr:P-loop NTPase fold protein [Pedobacter jejuensis]RNL54161.1 hypothetical protein D7004_08690 [Pedobacter jejuensis]
MSDFNKLKFQQLENKFANEFADVNNKQILFSGAFGSGKTTFLRDFAAENSDTIFTHIYPVNYTLHSNTDIYEILKYDIILELISLGCFKSEDVDSLLQYTYALSQTADGAVKKVLNLFSKTGKKLDDLQGIFKTSIDKFSKIKNNLSNPLLSVLDFGNEVDSLKGYEYEDFITSVIKEKLCNFKKNVVLIVDDLDTIDPEHLFRLISIFRAHIDHHTNENKFGFDKIIFVADVNNLKTMYAHRFGSSESFSGYISKLSSKDIFYFNPSKELYTNLNGFLSRIYVTLEGTGGKLPLLQNSSDNTKLLAVYLLANLVNINILNLRDLVKENVLHYSIDSYIDRYQSNLYHLDIYPIYTLIKYYVANPTLIKSTFTRIEDDPLGLNQVFQGVRNYEFMYSNFSVPFLEVISYLPEFKEKKENEIFEFKVDGKLFEINPFKQSMSRKLSFRVKDETISARDFFLLAGYCLSQFQKNITDL